MTIVIWILKASIASIFTFTGIYKIFLPKAKLLTKGMKGLIDLDENQIKAVGFLELLGALGLILPALLNMGAIIPAISALCLSLAMIIAGWINHELKLSIVPNIVIFVICNLIVIMELKSF